MGRLPQRTAPTVEGGAMTPEEAAAFWAELERAVRQVHCLRQPPPGRRRRTGEMRVTLTERRAMQAFHLLYGENYVTLARRFRRRSEYMSRWIWDEEYRAFHAYYWRTDAGHALIERRGRPVARTDAPGATTGAGRGVAAE